MKYGPLPPRTAPKQDSAKILLLAERWQRASTAHRRWAEPAKEAVRFFEGDQYTEAQIRDLRGQGRPHFKFNVISPIVRLVIGYQRNNKIDVKFDPGDDSISTEQVAEALSQIEKAIGKLSLMEFVDTEVFLDGLIAGRGWYDSRLDFENNDLGECKTISLDPFAVKPDPDADTYDLNESAAYMMYDRMVSIDEIEACFGKQAATLIRPFTDGQTPLMPLSSVVYNEEITPVRTFGLRDESWTDYWDQFHSLMGDFVDPQRKTIRLIEAQHKVREQRNVAIDLETGDKKVLPETWDRDKIEKIVLYAESRGNPLVVQPRMVERLQWSVMAGDMFLYDEPSMYDRYTQTGFFPYFRRGQTRGMVDDLVDPQKEKNKSRNARIEIESKTANGGWKYSDDALDPVQEANLKKFGSVPGVNVKWKHGAKGPPELITASQPSMSYEKLERQSDEDIRRISGINEAALGEIETVQSGRALEARQRQAVIQVQMYMDNFKRSKQIDARQHLGIIQNFYSEPRIYRITGEDGKLDQVHINQLLQDPTTAAKRIVNDVTVGKYVAQITDAPLSATFAAAQFEEVMALIEKGVIPPQMMGMFADLILGMSSLPRKDEWIERLKEMQKANSAPPEPKVSQSINFKDLPPEGQVQMAQEAGIHITPGSAFAHTAMANAPKALPAPAHGAQGTPRVPRASEASAPGLIPPPVAAAAGSNVVPIPTRAG